MFGKTGIKFGALALVALLSYEPADAVMKQMEIKGGASMTGQTISYGDGATALRGGGTDSVAYLDVDLDFKMKFSQDVTARIDLELDNATAGDTFFKSNSAGVDSTAMVNRYALGIDQAFFKMNDFLFKSFSLSVGKQNLNFSLRDNKSFSWAWGDPLSVVGAYSTRDIDLKFYWAKLDEQSTLSGGTNDNESDLLGVYGEYWLNDDSLVIGYLNSLSKVTGGAGVASTNANIIHYGLGLDYFVGENLEVYGEVAGQSIDMGATDGTALQLNLGLQYSFSDFDMKPAVNLEYYSQSGDGTGAGDVAYQNIAGGASAAENQSLFVEGNGRSAAVNDLVAGVGVVSFGGSAGTSGGYSVIRLSGWLSPTGSTKVGLGFHAFTDEDDSAGTTDDLGLEVDLTGSWKYSQDITFRAGAFLYQGADSQIVANAEVEDVTGLSLGSSLKF